MKTNHQFEMPVLASAVFNLAGETAEDPWRLERERWAQAERDKEAREYAAKMQLSLAQCPGFIGCDAPLSVNGKGHVVVEPGRIVEAMPWLKRRFHVNENLDLSPDNGLCIEIKPRIRSKRGCATGARSVRVTFGKPEQFELSFTKSE